MILKPRTARKESAARMELVSLDNWKGRGLGEV